MANFFKGKACLAIAGIPIGTEKKMHLIPGRADWAWLRIFPTGANYQGAGKLVTSPNLPDALPEPRFPTGANPPRSGFRWLGVVSARVGQIRASQGHVRPALIRPRRHPLDLEDLQDPVILNIFKILKIFKIFKIFRPLSS